METTIYGSTAEGLEVVSRDGCLYLHYDAGAHQVAWREGEITEAKFSLIAAGGNSEHQGVLKVQQRLIALGANPYVQNWQPSGS